MVTRGRVDNLDGRAACMRLTSVKFVTVNVKIRKYYWLTVGVAESHLSVSDHLIRCAAYLWRHQSSESKMEGTTSSHVDENVLLYVQCSGSGIQEARVMQQTGTVIEVPEHDPEHSKEPLERILKMLDTHRF